VAVLVLIYSDHCWQQLVDSVKGVSHPQPLVTIRRSWIEHWSHFIVLRNLQIIFVRETSPSDLDDIQTIISIMFTMMYAYGITNNTRDSDMKSAL